MQSKNFFENSVKIVNLILTLFCMLGFFYQVYLITSQYMLGKTVVSIEVKRLIYQPLPAITVCIPTYSIFSIFKTSKLNEGNKKTYQDYVKLVLELRQAAFYGKLNKTTEAQLKGMMNRIYQMNTLGNLRNVANFDQLNNLSLDYPILHSDYFRLYGETKSLLNESFISKPSLNRFQVYEKPINSFALHPHIYAIKCFTYLSALKEYWRSFQFDLDYIHITITNGFTQYPPVAYQISIHSPNTLKKYSELDYFEVIPNKEYSVKYSQMNNELLVDGYQANCAEYDIRNDPGTIRMESDCPIPCIIEICREDNWHSTYQATFDLIRREVWESFTNISLKLSNLIHRVIDSKKCSEKCKPDCNTKHFFIEISKIGEHNDLSQTLDKTIIKIKHSSIPDIIVRHSLEMTLMSFVCNFGGLLGMWLGLSLLSISKNIFQNFHNLCNIDRRRIYLSNKNVFKVNKLFVIQKAKASSNRNNLPIVEMQ